MIESSLLNAVKQYSQNIHHPVTLTLASGEHPKREELIEFLNDIAGAAPDKILINPSLSDDLPSPISFCLENQNGKTGIVFSGIPGGHEFSSLILALLQAGGHPLKLDNSIQALVKNISQPLHFQTYVSLSCHNCPDVVQALNQFALLNPHISSEMIDGGLFQEAIEARNIQGVPAVFLNGKPFANGKIDTAKLLEKLLEHHPEIAQNTAPTPSLPVQDVTVIGGGPAGVSAAIYAARKGLAVTIVADRIGGQVKDTMDIENLISTPLTTGPELAIKLRQHLEQYAVTLRENLSVANLIKGDKTHQIVLKTGETIESRTVIVASGAKWRELGVPGEKENLGNGVAYCPHCDGPFFKGKHVAVIGGGNSGVEAALDLAGIVRHVSVFEFMPTLKADKVLVDAMAKRDNIDVYTNQITQAIHAENGKVTALAHQDRETGENKTLPLDGVFVQIGLVPNSDFVGEDSGVQKTRFGEIEVNDKCETNVPGIFAAGDVATVPYKQIIIAMGEGAKAALSAFDYLIRR